MSAPKTQPQNQQLQKVGAGAITLGAQYGYTPEYVSLIKRTVAPAATDDELQLFLSVCSHAKLNPLNKEIYFWKDNDDRVVIHTGIQGYRIAAERTKCYAPGRPVKREYDKNGNLFSSTAYVQKFVGGQWFEIEETALWSEWSKNNRQWKGQYGYHQLDITAERHALRKAFPQLAGIDASEAFDEGGVYTNGTIPKESAEARDRRDEIGKALVLVGNIFCNEEQMASLNASIVTAPVPVLEERLEKAIVRLRQEVLAEAGRLYKDDEYEKFLVGQFPRGVDDADVYELLAVLGVLNAEEQVEGTDYEGEPLSAEDEALVELRTEVMAKLMSVANGDPAKIDDLLNGREVNNMSTEQLTTFLDGLKGPEDPF